MLVLKALVEIVLEHLEGVWDKTARCPLVDEKSRLEYVVSTRTTRRSIMPSRSPVHFASIAAAASGISTTGASAGADSAD
jgi:hypothetical protein